MPLGIPVLKYLPDSQIIFYVKSLNLQFAVGFYILTSADSADKQNLCT
jgi:hypothetical protein